MHLGRGHARAHIRALQQSVHAGACARARRAHLEDSWQRDSSLAAVHTCRSTSLASSSLNTLSGACAEFGSRGGAVHSSGRAGHGAVGDRFDGMRGAAHVGPRTSSACAAELRARHAPTHPTHPPTSSSAVMSLCP